MHARQCAWMCFWVAQGRSGDTACLYVCIKGGLVDICNVVCGRDLGRMAGQGHGQSKSL